MAYTSDRLDHAGILFNHLDRLGKAASEIFLKEYKDGNICGALPSSKIQNWYTMVKWFETQLIAYLGKQYGDRRVKIREQYNNAWKKKDLHGCFDAANELAQILMLEATSNGFMMKRVISGDWIVKPTED